MLNSLVNSTVKLRQIKLSNASKRRLLDFGNDMKGAGDDASILITQKAYTKFGIVSVINCRCFWHKGSRLIDYKSEAATSMIFSSI